MPLSLSLPCQVLFLRSLSLSPAGIARAIVKRPQVFAPQLTPEGSWKLLLEYFCLLGLTPEQVGAMVVRHPRLLQLSVSQDISPKVGKRVGSGR